jgi:hypothetical protein
MVDDPPFYALIMAAMTKADTDNLIKLQNAFPDVWVELQARYNAVRGILPSDGEVDTKVLDENLRRMGLR